MPQTIDDFRSNPDLMLDEDRPDLLLAQHPYLRDAFIDARVSDAGTAVAEDAAPGFELVDGFYRRWTVDFRATDDPQIFDVVAVSVGGREVGSGLTWDALSGEDHAPAVAWALHLAQLQEFEELHGAELGQPGSEARFLLAASTAALDLPGAWLRAGHGASDPAKDFDELSFSGSVVGFASDTGVGYGRALRMVAEHRATINAARLGSTDADGRRTPPLQASTVAASLTAHFAQEAAA